MGPLQYRLSVTVCQGRLVRYRWQLQLVRLHHRDLIKYSLFENLSCEFHDVCVCKELIYRLRGKLFSFCMHAYKLSFYSSIIHSWSHVYIYVNDLFIFYVVIRLIMCLFMHLVLDYSCYLCKYTHGISWAERPVQNRIVLHARMYYLWDMLDRRTSSRHDTFAFSRFVPCSYIISLNMHTEYSMFLWQFFLFVPTCQEPEAVHNRDAILTENHHSHYWLMVDDQTHVSNQYRCMKSLLSRVSFIDCERIGSTSQEKKKKSGRVAWAKHHDHFTHWIITTQMTCV